MKARLIAVLAITAFTAATGAQEAHAPFSEDGNHYGDPVESVKLEFDSPFCDNDGDEKISDEELKEGPNCIILEDGNTVFDKKPITALGLAKGELALTIDDGPNPKITLPLLDLFDKYQIKATFFMVGRQAEAHPDVVREIARRGHVVANHSHTHDVANITANTILSEVQRADEAIRRALGGKIPNRLLFRAPGLAWNGQKAMVLNNNGATRKYIGPIHANLGTDAPAADWSCWGKGVSSKGCADMYFRDIVNAGRGVILTHDIFYKPGRPNSYEMTKILLERLDREGGGIKRGGTGPGLWKFVSLQDRASLDKYEVDGSNLPSNTQQAPAPVVQEKTNDGLDIVTDFKSGNIFVRSEALLQLSELDNNSLIGIGDGTVALKTADLQAVADTGEQLVRAGRTFRKVRVLRVRQDLQFLVGLHVYISVSAF